MEPTTAYLRELYVLRGIRLTKPDLTVPYIKIPELSAPADSGPVLL